MSVVLTMLIGCTSTTIPQNNNEFVNIENSNSTPPISGSEPKQCSSAQLDREIELYICARSHAFRADLKRSGSQSCSGVTHKLEDFFESNPQNNIGVCATELSQELVKRDKALTMATTVGILIGSRVNYKTIKSLLLSDNAFKDNSLLPEEREALAKFVTPTTQLIHQINSYANDISKLFHLLLSDEIEYENALRMILDNPQKYEGAYEVFCSMDLLSKTVPLETLPSSRLNRICSVYSN